jgi:hypothetical protein
MYISKPDGSRTEFKPKGERVTLEEMKSIVDGFIEFVWPRNSPKLMMVCNEDGINRGLKPNAEATNIYGYGVVVGNVLIATRAEYNKYIRHPEDMEV